MLREKLFIGESKIKSCLKNLAKLSHLSESLILSTCNRTEVYAVTTSFKEGKQEIINFLVGRHRIPREKILKALYCYTGETAVRHLFSVTAGIDSMILGETQILGQVKRSLLISKEAGNVGSILHRLLTMAIHTGKKARSKTGISRGSASVSTAAVKKAESLLGSFQGKSILAIGAGKMSALALKQIACNDGVEILLANRTRSKALNIAENLEIKVISMNNLWEALKKVDLVFTCTSSSGYILTKRGLEPLLKKRKRPLFIIDIAVPRDVEPSAGELAGLILIDLDELKDITEEEIEKRRLEVEKVKLIIESGVRKFAEFYRLLHVSPLIIELEMAMDNFRIQHLKKILSSSGLSDREKNLLEKYGKSLMKNFLHIPLTRLKKLAKEDIPRENLQLIKEILTPI